MLGRSRRILFEILCIYWSRTPSISQMILIGPPSNLLIPYNSTVFTSPMWHLTCRLHGPRCARRLSFLSRVTWAARDAYSVMGLDRSATPQEVKERFRTLAKLLGAHGEMENIGLRVCMVEIGRGSLRAQDASATLRPPWRMKLISV